MLVGKVKWFNNEKGYGFIIKENYDDIFVHYSQIMEEGYRSLNEGQQVQFDLAQTERGLQAKKVYKIGVCYKECLINENFGEENDIKVDTVITN